MMNGDAVPGEKALLFSADSCKGKLISAIIPDSVRRPGYSGARPAAFAGCKPAELRGHQVIP